MAIKEQWRKYKFVAIGMCLFAVLASTVMLWIYPKIIAPSKQYEEAEIMFRSGNYKEAAEVFAAISNYKDAEEQKNEALLRYALELVGKWQFEEANEIMKEIWGYSDSRDQILNAQYQEVLKTCDSHNYSKAEACQAF